MTGTRFAIYPQSSGDWLTPQVITVSVPPGRIGPGPEDATLRTILPLHKARPYDPPAYMPPYSGPCHPPARPDRDGHFDHIDPADPAFLPAHMYACVRHTMDVWERYLGRQVTWWHAEAFPQIELTARVEWDNAQSGMGFIETGHRPNLAGVDRLFCLNFDVVGHETGHALLFSEVGAPGPGQLSGEFLAFHECFSDLVAMVASLHFPTMMDRLLRQTGGNLYVLNMLNRVGEMSGHEQIRIADNTTGMADLAGLRLGPGGDWIDPTGQNRNAHAMAQPLTGAIFDLFVEMFQQRLVALGALPPRLDARAWMRDGVADALDDLQTASAKALAAFGRAFHAALRHARDMLGLCMAHVMTSLPADRVSFAAVAAEMVRAAIRHGHAAPVDVLADLFRRRGIDPGPHLAAALVRPSRWTALPYAERMRRVAQASRGRGCGCHSGELQLVNRLVRHPERAHPRKRIAIS